MPTTREEHMNWCKTRALEYVEKGDLTNGITSMLSDLGKHDETREHGAIQLTMMLLMSGNLDTAEKMKKHIEGFN